MLDIWPALPLIIQASERYPTRRVDNIVAALKCSDRVCHIELAISNILDWEIHFAVMQQPFPELKYLDFVWHSSIEEMVVVPNSFLGGLAPRLEYLCLEGIPFPGMLKFLLSTTHLVTLRLDDIPHSGYISPDVMVAALSTLTSLDFLSLIFESPESCPDLETRRLPSSTRSVLPILTGFRFQGVSEYLEDLVTDIDAPQLNNLRITFFNDSVFDMPQLIRFISRTPMWSSLEIALVFLHDNTAGIHFRPQTHDHVDLRVSTLCEGLDWQLSSLEQVCTSCLPVLSTLRDLHIYDLLDSRPDWKDNIENRLWLELLHPFAAVKNLYIPENISPRIGPALQELTGGRATELLPTLENIFLKGLESSGHVQKGIGQFVTARQVSSHPVTISRWEN